MTPALGQCLDVDVDGLAGHPTVAVADVALDQRDEVTRCEVLATLTGLVEQRLVRFHTVSLSREAEKRRGGRVDLRTRRSRIVRERESESSYRAAAATRSSSSFWEIA